MRFNAALMLFFAAAFALRGTAQGPAFEVVSIRPHKPGAFQDGLVATDVVRVVGNQLRAINISALGLIYAAYRSDYPYRDQIVDADGWIASEPFDVEARAAGVLSEKLTAPPLPATAALMLQQLLRERFQLRLRRETRELPRLILTYARADRSLKPGIRISDQNCPAVLSAPGAKCEYLPMAGKLTMRGQPIQVFADYLSIPAYSGGRVLDATGITKPRGHRSRVVD